MIPGLGDRIEAWGSRVAPGPGARRRRGLRLRPAARRQPGARLHALRRADPRRRDHGLGGAGLHRGQARGRARLRGRLGRRALPADARRAAARRPAAAYRAWVQAATGAAMVLVALAMTADLDLEFQNAIADDLPAVLVNPSGELEEQRSRRRRPGRGPRRRTGAAARAGSRRPPRGSSCPTYGAAPDFVGPGEWFNTGGEPLSIAELNAEGRVVLIDFWTYTCINCIRTLPYLTAWDSEYRDDGLVIVGVHAPEFAFERDAGNVADAIERHGIAYPVVQDNELRHLERVRQPVLARQVPDRRRRPGPLRRTSARARYEETEAAIRSLLAEAGDAAPRRRGERRRAERADPGLRTPGDLSRHRSRRTAGSSGPHAGHPRLRRRRRRDLRPERVRLRRPLGRRRASRRRRSTTRRSRSASRRGGCSSCSARRGGPRRARGRCSTARRSPRAAPARTSTGGAATDRRQRLYRLVDLPRAGRHELELRFEPGISGYAFTFG